LASQRSKLLGYTRLAGVYSFIGILAWNARPTPLLFAVGTLIALVGETIRLWAAGHLVKSVELIDSGPYAHTQNPLYLGRLLILTGFCLMARNDYHLNWIGLAIGYVVFFGYYVPRKMRVEGGRLHKMHGEAWVRYSSSVPILIPSVARYAGQQRSWSLHRALNNQEYLVLTGVLFVLALFARKTWPS